MNKEGLITSNSKPIIKKAINTFLINLLNIGSDSNTPVERIDPKDREIKILKRHTFKP